MQNEDRFQRLDQTLQGFIHQYGLGCIKIEDLINSNAEALQSTVVQQREIADGHVIHQHENTNQLVRDESDKTRQEISKSTAVQLDQKQREKLLASLNFSGRNERLNHIREAHYESFQWLFKSPDTEVASKSLGDDTTKSVVGQRSDDKNIYDQGNDDWVLENITYQTKRRAWANFNKWLESDEQMYWVCGKAGAGKSTLIRFLSSDPKTQCLLDKEGGEKPILLWHYFYLMGNPMQHSIKGLLCNLLHQLLGDNGNERMAHLLDLFPAADRKLSETDWSEQELQASLSNVIQYVLNTRRLCVFLDGLDEIHPDDGADKLLNFLQYLCSIDPLKIKLCVSSREETAFKKELSSYPLLHLHYLTAPDIYQYSFDNFKDSEQFASGNMLSFPQEREWSPERQKWFYPKPSQLLAQTFVEKSEGVFLWAYLATKSLKRALCNEDSAETIQKRLEVMPGDLKELYNSMWNRLNDDEKLYKADAALYFNLVIEYSNRSLGTFYRLDYSSLRPTLGHISLACEVINTLEQDGKIFTTPLESIGHSCKTHYYGIQTRCAGLLEFSRGPYIDMPKPGQEFLYSDMEVNFIHRTAREFLLETPEGKSILNEDKISGDLCLASIIHAWLLRSWTFLSPKYIGNQKICSLQSSLRSGYDLYHSYSRLPSATKIRWVEGWHSILHKMPKSCYHWTDVLGWTAQYLLKDFVSISFRQPNIYTEEYKTYVLKFAATTLYVRFDKVNEVLPDSFDMIDFLLSQGCEPQTISEWHLSSKNDAFLTHHGPFVTFIQSLFSLLSEKFEFSENIGVRILHTLQNFIEHKADLSQEIYCFLQQGAIRDSWGRPLDRISKEWRFTYNKLGTVLLLKVSACELLRRLAQYSRDTDFGDQLARMISAWNLQSPKIVAIGYEDLKTWSKSARRVDETLEQRLLEIIMRTKPCVNSYGEEIEEGIQRERDKVIEGYDFKGVEPVDLTECLLFDEGLLKKNPETLDVWLMTNVDKVTWGEMRKATRAVPTRLLSNVVSDDFSEAFTLLWGCD